MHGCSIVDLAPLVAENDEWLNDIEGGVSMVGFMEFLWPQMSIQQSLLIVLTSMARLLLSHGSAYGKHGLLGSASFVCGWH